MTQKSTLQNIVSLLVFTAFVGFLSNCEKKKEDNNDAALLVGLAAAFNMAGDCNIAAGSRTLNTFTTEFTGTSGTIAKTSSVPVVGHQTAAIKLAGRTAGSSVKLSGGKSFLIVYNASTCPISAEKAVTIPAITIANVTSSNEQFTNSYQIDTDQATITFPTAGDYYILIYAIPARGQIATLNYGTP
jgi:hypothetical protein